MPKPLVAIEAWKAQSDELLSHETSLNEFADLLESVNPRWFGALNVHYNISQIWILPLGGSLNKGSSLWIKKSKSGFSFEIKFNPGLTQSRTVARRRSTLEKAPVVLAPLLDEFFEGPEEPTSKNYQNEWASLVQRLRAHGKAEVAKAELLLSLGPK